ncbi:unnamed protein product [Closterium sp. NIES-54]
MDEASEGVGVGGGAGHEGSGEGAPRVVVEYSYEEEEEIEEDTSRGPGVSGPGGNADEQEGSSSESSSGSSLSDESIEHDGEGLGLHLGWTERTEKRSVALGERVDEQQATGDDWDVEKQEDGAAGQDFGTGVQQQEGGAAAQEGEVRGQQQEGMVAAQEGGAGGQEQEGREAAQERLVTVRRHRTASGSGQAGPSTAGRSTSAIASEGQVVELLQRVAEVEASQRKLVADVFAKHSEQAVVFNKLARDFWRAWNMISKSSKSTLKQCGDAVNGVTEERKLLEGARSKLDEMSGKIIKGVAAAITKASEDAVEKQLKLVEEWLGASLVKGIEKAIKEDLFYSTLPPESMKELKDVLQTHGQQERLALWLPEVHLRTTGVTDSAAKMSGRSNGPTGDWRSGITGLPEAHLRTTGTASNTTATSTQPPSTAAPPIHTPPATPLASPPSRARQTIGKSVEDKDVIVLDRSPRQQTSEAASKPPPDAFAPLRDMLQGLGKKGEKGVVAGEKSGAPIGQVASARKGAMEKQGAPIPSSDAAGKGAREKRGAPSQVAVAAELLSKAKADSAAQLGIAGRPDEPVGKRSSSVLGDVSLSEPGSPPPGPRPRSPSASKKRLAVMKSTKRAAEATESRDVELASTVVAARHKKSKKPKVIGYAPPPPPDDQGKTRGCKAPFKGPVMMSRKGKPVSEQTVGSRKRFLGTFETEADQKFCTAICWRVYFPDIDLKEYKGFMAQDEKDWKVYLDAAARMPTGVWSVAQEQGECRFDNFWSLLTTTNTEVRAGTDWGIALCAAIGKVAMLGRRHGNVIYPVPKNMHRTAHMMALAATVASLWAACRKLSREDIKKDALAAANAALYAPEMATRASAAAMAALLSVFLIVPNSFASSFIPVSSHVSLADPSGGPVLASFSTVLPCPAAPSGSLSGLYLPSFSTNLVSGADLQDQGVDQFTPASQRVTHCTCARTGRHLATFTRRPGSSLYTLSTESSPVSASGQVAASSQVLAAASGSGPASAPCSCRLLSHQTLLWHHRLGHPSLPRLRGMASCVLVSGLPRSLPPLPPGPAPTCVPCVEGRQRAAPHSSEFPPTEAPLQTLHMDVWGPARVRGQGHKRYFLLVVDDYSRYTTVFPLRSKREVTEVLIDWIRAARLRLRDSFGSDFPVLRLHSDKGGEFSSALLGAFCRAQGIRQTFTLPASPQQNGIAERRIGMVMDVARTSMIHAAAPHFLWPFAVQYAAHQLNLQPRVSLPETSPTLLWTGKVGDVFAFRVWGSRAFVRDLSADKLSPRVVPCVFLGFPPDAPGWQFYHPTSRRVLSSQDVTFDESVPYYCLFPYRTASLPPPPLFLAPGPPPVDPLPPQGPAPSGVSQVDAVEPVEVAVDSGAATGAEPAGAGSGGAGSGGAETEGAEPGGAETRGAELGGAETGGADPGGAATGGTEPGGAEPGVTEPEGAEPGGAGSARVASRGVLSRREGRAAGAGGTTATTCPGGAGAAGPGGPAEAAGVGPTGGSAGASSGTGAAGSAGPGDAGATGVGAAGGVGAGGSADAGTSEGAGAGAAGAGGATGAGAPAGSPGAVPPESGGTPRPRPYFVPLLEQVLGLPPSPGPAPSFPCPQPVPSQSLLQPVSPLPAPSPYTGPTGGLAERRAPASRPASPLVLGRVVVVEVVGACMVAVVLVVAVVGDVEVECALSTDVLEDRQEEFQCFAAALPHLVSTLLAPEGDPDAPDIPTPRSYAEAIEGPYSSQWQAAMDAEMASWKSTGTYVDEVPPPGANIVSGMWIFRVKRPPCSPPVFKARYVARGFSQRQGVDYFQTFSPTPKMTTLRVLLHVAAQRDYELHSLDFSTAFLQGSLHEEIWLRRPPGFTGSFPPGTQWSLRRPVNGLRQAPREWHDTLRTTLAVLGFAPSTADPSLFLRTDTSLPPFYVLVYVDDLVFATADTAGLAHVKSELQKRHTCTDLGELRSYPGLQITRDRAQRTITLTQSHMVQQVLQRFDFTYSSPQATPLSTRHSLSALPSDESVEPDGPYPELVGCLMYLMSCTRPDLAYPLSILARYVAPGRHRPEHMAAAKRVLRYLCSTSGMGLVLGGRRPVVLTGHADASWADDQATQRSSQGYTFSLGSGSVSWRSTRSSSVLSSSCEAEIYAGAMAAQELRWLTYLLTDLGEQPRSPPFLYVDNKAMLALCREHRLEHRTKHIALRYFLSRELQQRGQLRLAYVASEANTADIFTKALAPGDHQRFCTLLGFPTCLGSSDATLLQMVRVAAQVCTQWCCCQFAARLLEDAGYWSLAMPEEKRLAKLGDEEATEAETGGQGE